MTKSQFFKSGVKAGIPIALGYLAVSFSFGIIAAENGLSIAEATLISLTNLTSAGQFAGLGIIAAGGSYFEMILSQLIINLRYCLMSFSLSQKITRNEPKSYKYIAAFGITDEIFGVSATQDGKISSMYILGAVSVALPGWTVGTLLGAISGNLLPKIVVTALSVAIYGMFTAIILPPAKKNKAVLVCIISAMLLSTLFSYAPLLKKISSGFVIIIITVLVSGIAAAVAPVEDDNTEVSTDEG